MEPLLYASTMLSLGDANNAFQEVYLGHLAWILPITGSLLWVQSGLPSGCALFPQKFLNLSSII